MSADERGGTGAVGAGAAVRLYLLAGVRSAPRYLEGLGEALEAALGARGYAARARLAYPYDDWSRRLLPQLREVRHDIMLPYRRYGRSIGGRRALAAVEAEPAEADRMPGSSWPSPFESDRIVLVGHSAGGVAAVHVAGLLLARGGGRPVPVVMIGSPKCRIPEPLRDSVYYVQSVPAEETAAAASRAGWWRTRGGTSDPVCRIGSFGGWSRGRLPLPWRGDRHAPAARATVPVVGGHADYFRARPPYVHASGRTNLEETLSVVLPWLTAKLEEAGPGS